MTVRQAAARLICALGLACLAVAAAPAPPPSFAYELAPVVENGVVTALSVSLKFRGPASGTLRFDLPDKSEGQTERWRFLTDLQVQGATMIAPDPATRMLAFTPGARVTLRYTVRSAYAAEPAGIDGNPYRGAILRPRWFAALGDYIFVAPHDGDSWPAAFHWGILPKGWTVASDLEHGAYGRAMTVHDIDESTLLGGTDVTLYRRAIPGGELRFAVRGTWSFSPTHLADILSRTLAAQRVFWGGDVKGPFLVTLFPLSGAGSSGGTGRSDGFALYGTSDTSETIFSRTIAHEHTHSWIPSRIGTLSEEADQPAEYWFSEGFTEFYTERTMLKSGIWPLEEFVGDLNDRLLAYGISPVRNAPNTRIVKDFWTDENVSQLPYQRGLLLAYLWDRRLRDAGKGKLDAVMFAARDAYAAADVKPRAAANFLAAFARTGIDLTADLARYVETGDTVTLPADLFGDCASVRTLDISTFDAGFDREKSAATGTITGVDPLGPAYAAGLRDGMRRIGREGGKEGDARVKLGYRVVDASGQERLIAYFPAGHGTQTIQSVEMASSLAPAQRAVCARQMSGG